MSNKVILTVKLNNNRLSIQNIKLPSSSPSPLINYYTKGETDSLLDNKLDITKLNKAINAALKEAKDSGLFDGEDGLPGPQGPAGPQGILGEQGAKGEKGENGSSFEDARNFEEENLENIELKDGDLFYVEQKEEFKETLSREFATIIEVSPELEEQTYREIIGIENNEAYLNKNALFPNIYFYAEINENFILDRMRLWKYEDSYSNDYGEFITMDYYGIFLLPNKMELPFSEDEFSSTEYITYTKEQIQEYSKIIPTFTMVSGSNAISLLLYDNMIYVSYRGYWTIPSVIKYSQIHKDDLVNVYNIPVLRSAYDEFNNFNLNDSVSVIICKACTYISYYNITIGTSDTIANFYDETISNHIRININFTNDNKAYFNSPEYTETLDLDNPYISYPLFKELENLLSFIKYYEYYAPIKQYIMYSQGRFYTLGDKDQRSLVNRKTLLKVLEAIEESESENFSLTLTTIELFQLFNIKIVSEQYILLPLSGPYGFLYMNTSPAFNMKFIDREHVKIWIGSGSYSGSESDGSSQELYIGEFEEQ